jgi:predicted glycosyl hydrolase (DUF1957 family)
MSGNIHDTKVNLLKEQIKALKTDISALRTEGADIDDWVGSTGKKKYKTLFKTSETLFKYIVTNYGTDRCNKQFLDQTLEMMLSKVSSIQNSEMSQEDASAFVGNILAKKYIPQMKSLK